VCHKAERDLALEDCEGSGNGRTVEVRSVSMPPQAWQMLDEFRAGTSRGVWISSRIWRDYKAKLETELRAMIK
jgi:hypothetical protein